jgi:hypothetical protein
VEEARRSMWFDRRQGIPGLSLVLVREIQHLELQPLEPCWLVLTASWL